MNNSYKKNLNIKNFPISEFTLSEKIGCFLKWPKNYLYVLSYSRNKIIKMSKYDPIIEKISSLAKERIHRSAPDLKIIFFGSSSLKIIGQKDIDIFIESSPQDFKKNIELLKNTFGSFKTKKADFAEWLLVREGYTVDLVLINPNSQKFKDQMWHFNILKNHKDAREDYKKLKFFSDGLSEREYEELKILFFYRMHKKYFKKT